MNMPTISTIICVHNQKYELRKSLESVKEQSMRPDEVIIVDYSPDNACRDFAETCMNSTASNVRYVYVPQNEALPFDEVSAFETGLKYSSCDYAAFLVAGDVWTKEKISELKSFAEENPDKDVILSSYKKYVGFKEKSNFVTASSHIADGVNSLFMYWYAPSAVAMKTKLALALKGLSSADFETLKVGYISSCLSTIFYGVERDSVLMEKLFWNKFYSRIRELDVIQEAALFCIREYQNDVRSRESLELFAKTVELKPDDVVKAVFGVKDFAKSGGAFSLNNPNPSKEQNERNRQNYLLMRDWVEMKIAGKSVAQNLKEKSVETVAIFGAGKHGTMLFNDLKSSGIKIAAWLDNNPKASEISGCPVYSPCEFSRKNIKTDVIIVTPYLEYEEIAKDLDGFGLKNLISLKDIIG